MFMTSAAPPKSAPIPIAPVAAGCQAAPLELLLPPLVAELWLPCGPGADWVAIVDVGVGTPEVNGTLLADVALGKASAVVAVFGTIVELDGLRTRSMT